MYQASFTATDSADWAEAIEFIDGDTSLPLDISTTDFALTVRDKFRSPVLTGTTGDGAIQRVGNVIRWRFSATAMRAFCVGNTYPVGLTMTTGEGTEQVLVGTLSYIDGIVL